MAEEEGEQEGADVGAVDIGVRHEDDLVVARFVDVETALVITVPYPCADGGYEGLDFRVL